MTRVGRRQRGGGCGAGRFVPTGEYAVALTGPRARRTRKHGAGAGVTVGDTNMCEALTDGADRQDGM